LDFQNSRNSLKFRKRVSLPAPAALDFADGSPASPASLPVPAA
jgi:hypothetical protein